MMAAVRLTVPLIVAVISVAILLNVASLSYCTWWRSATEAVSKSVKSHQEPEDIALKTAEKLEILKSYKKSLLEDELDYFKARNKLIELYQIFRFYEMPEEFNSFKDQVVALVRLHDRHRDPCTVDNRNNYNQMMEEYKGVPSLRAFTEHYVKIYLSQCNSDLYKKTDENVRKIPPEHLNDVNLLDAYYRLLLSPEQFELDYSKPSEHTEELSIALSNFLLTKSINQEVSQYDVYHEHVIVSCNHLLDATNEALHIADDPFDDKLVPERAPTYIKRGRICKHIIENDKQIQKDLDLNQDKIAFPDENARIESFDIQLCTDEIIKEYKDSLKFTFTKTQTNKIKSFLSMCFFAIGEEMQHNVDTILPEHKCELEYLKRSVTALSSGESWHKSWELEEHKSDVRKATWRFLASKILGYDEAAAPNAGKKHIGQPCKNWLQATERARRVADYFVCYDRLCDQKWKANFDDYVEKGDICEYITNETVWDEIIREARREHYFYDSCHGTGVKQCVHNGI